MHHDETITFDTVYEKVMTYVSAKQPLKLSEAVKKKPGGSSGKRRDPNVVDVDAAQRNFNGR